jgi:hypothetical protein
MKRFALLVLLGLGSASGLSGAPTVSEDGAVARPFRFRLEAGQFAAFRWLPDRQRLVVEHLPTMPGPLPARAATAVRRAPPWLRDGLRAQMERLLRAPIRVPPGARTPGLADVTGDGRAELLVWDGVGDAFAFAAPDWRSVHVDRGRLPGEWLSAKGPVRLDVNGDGLDDLVRVNEEGFVVFRRGRGVPGRLGHLLFRMDSLRFFRHEAGTACRPAIRGDHFVLGDLDGQLTWYVRDGASGHAKALELPGEAVPKGKRFAAPALGDLDGDGRPEVVLGSEDGGIAIFRSPTGPEAPAWRPTSLGEGLSAGAFSSPTLGDVDGDGDLDILCGNREGRILLFRNVGTPTEARFEAEEDEALAKIDVGDSSAPAAGDVTGDGACDLVVGNQAGELRVFEAPGWNEVEGAFAGYDVGELATPAIVDGNGPRPRVVVGCLDGDLVQFVPSRPGEDLRYTERDSWSFTPEPGGATPEEVYARRYFPEEENVLGANDGETLEAYAGLLLRAPRDLVDEIAFAVARTPPEVLRAMARLGQADVLLENAEAIRDVAARVPYARLVEREDHTTIAYVKEDGELREAPRDVYYWWVVHPRILYEIPCRVDVTWWGTSAKARGMSDSAWWKREAEPDIHAPTDAARFWRTALLADDRHGEPLMARISRARTPREALLAINAYMAHGQGYMRFGYETQDMQPWLIHAKRYGSCGEHSILGTAMARAALIPACVVSDRGEDHQWNEWWDVDGHWHHWDASGGSVDTPWTSTEGREHRGKTVSSVTRWRGDDRMDETTTTVWNDPEWGYTEKGRGYTDVGSLSVRVLDGSRKPVDGALVILRSHWENRNLVTLWGYTDGNGRSPLFALGYEPNGGYTVEVLTPLGSAGVRSLPVEEGRHHALTLTVPGETPPFCRTDWIQPAVKPGDARPEREKASIEGTLRPPSYVTASPYRIAPYMTERHGYRGTRGHTLPIRGVRPEVLVFAPEEYEGFLAGVPCRPWYRARSGDWPTWPDREHVLVFVNDALFAAADVVIEGEPPAGEAVAAVLDEPAPVRQGDVLTLRGGVSRPSAVESLTLRCAALGLERDVLGDLDRSSGAFAVDVHTGDGGPWPAGTYDLVVEARAHGRGAIARATVTVEPSRTFRAQRIRQDDPDDPLGGGAWTYGPFTLDGTDRFLLVKTRSLAEGFDCDVHLYFDKNGNGRLDGAGERIASSTSPTAIERIVREAPAAGTYWLVCHGWRVTGEWAPLDVEIHPRGEPRAIVDVRPAGRHRTPPEEIGFRLLPFAQIDPGTVKVTRDGSDRTTRAGVAATGARWNPGPALPENAEVTYRVEARHRAGRLEVATWTVVVDTIPPTLEILTPAADVEPTGKLVIEARAADEGSKVTVEARTANGEPSRLRPVKDRPGVRSVELDTGAWPEGEVYVWIVARDEAGNETERVLRVRKPKT